MEIMEKGIDKTSYTGTQNEVSVDRQEVFFDEKDEWFWSMAYEGAGSFPSTSRSLLLLVHRMTSFSQQAAATKKKVWYKREIK